MALPTRELSDTDIALVSDAYEVVPYQVGRFVLDSGVLFREWSTDAAVELGRAALQLAARITRCDSRQFRARHVYIPTLCGGTWGRTGWQFGKELQRDKRLVVVLDYGIVSDEGAPSPKERQAKAKGSSTAQEQMDTS